LRPKPAAAARRRASAVRAQGPNAMPTRIAAASDPSGISTPSSDRKPPRAVWKAHAPVPSAPSDTSASAAIAARSCWL
jgi:hypothetical protein